MRIGIIGAGQLGQMLGFAGRKLGLSCLFVDPSAEPPAAACGNVIRARYDDTSALARLAAECDVVTYEFENVPVAALASIADDVAILPPPAALGHAQDRLAEKRLFDLLGIPVGGYRRIDTRADLDTAAAALGLPMVVKTRRLGYDGKGQSVVGSDEDLDAAWQALGGQRPLIAEQWIAFDCEVSVIGVRAQDGEIRTYPLSRNEHVGGILRVSRAPHMAPALQALAERYIGDLLAHLDYVGVLALELFAVGDRLLANEFAPRVHNSGHWTIEGAVTSQFENHLRAVAGLPLGDTHCPAHAGMVNLIGEIREATRSVGIGNLHDYGKAPRPGRKLGHVTVIGASAEERDRQVDIILGTLD